MARIFMIISIVSLAFVGLFMFSPVRTSDPALIVIGGEYTLQPGEVRQGNVYILFARVNIMNGGIARGNVKVFGSDLNVNGSIDGNIESWMSTLTLEPQANVSGKVNSIGLINQYLLLPSIFLAVM